MRMQNLPFFRNWQSGQSATGNFTISKNSRIVINAADKDTLSSMAETFAADYKDIVGNDISVVYGSESDVKAGDFYFALTAKEKA